MYRWRFEMRTWCREIVGGGDGVEWEKKSDVGFDFLYFC